MSDDQRLNVVELCERVAILEEENRQLRVLLMPAAELPAVLGLSRKETEMVALLFKASPRVVRQEAILSALYLHKSDLPEPQVIKVMLCAVRKKLRPFGITIETTHAIGLSMHEASAARLRIMGGVP